MKPNAGVYLAAAQNVQTPPQHCLFIDDLQANVEGARAVGMHAIRFENVEALVRDLKDLDVLSFDKRWHKINKSITEFVQVLEPEVQ